MMTPPPEVQSATFAWQAATDDLVAIALACDPGRWDAPSACGDWTNQQLLVHIATGYGMRIAALEAVIGSTVSPAIDADAANAGNIARLAGATIDDILTELKHVRGRVLALLSRLTPGHLDARTALGGGKSVREALATLAKHDLDHAAELRG